MTSEERIAQCYESLRALTPSQYLAINILETGATHQAAADGAGVHRVTVSRWVHHHPAFRAELNRRCEERSERLSAKIAEITFDALEVIHEAIQGGDANTALVVMKQLRLDTLRDQEHDRRRREPTTADAIIDKEAAFLENARLYEIRNPAYRDFVVLRRSVEINEPLTST